MNDKIKSVFTIIGICATVSTVFYLCVMKPLSYVRELEHKNRALSQQVLKLEERISEYEAECESDDCEWKGYKKLEPAYSRLVVNE